MACNNVMRTGGELLIEQCDSIWNSAIQCTVIDNIGGNSRKQTRVSILMFRWNFRISIYASSYLVFEFYYDC